MEAPTERLTDPAPKPEERHRSAWELIDEEWDGKVDAPMCM